MTRHLKCKISLYFDSYKSSTDDNETKSVKTIYN